MEEAGAQKGREYPTIYVGDLEEQVNDEGIYNFFIKFGYICKIKSDKDPLFKNRFALVTFNNQNNGKINYSTKE